MKKVFKIIVIAIAVLGMICGLLYATRKIWRDEYASWLRKTEYNHISQSFLDETYIPPEDVINETFTRSWRSYKLATKIISKSKYIYEGVVTDISYKVLENNEIVTVYTVSVKESYKGETPKETYVVRGGVIEEDIDKWKKLAIETDNPKVDIGSYINLEIGEEYLFCIKSRDDSNYDQILNSTQFAFKTAHSEEYSSMMIWMGMWELNVLVQWSD
ncbi:MAG: hypothetical protein IKC38_02370 [Clostridia bacterium]|nr:hypothetical protein [Clostridia bacterium]